MTIPYSSVAVANTFIDEFGELGGIEHMKLQKLVYCSYGWWLGHYGLEHDRLTTDRPEIWRHGPVFPELYHTFKVFGRTKITEMKPSNPFSGAEMISSEDEGARLLIKWIWGRYGHMSSFSLSDMTHKPGTPWHRVATENSFRIDFNTEIPDEYIFEEFQRLSVASDLISHSDESVLDAGQRQQA